MYSLIGAAPSGGVAQGVGGHRRDERAPIPARRQSTLVMVVLVTLALSPALGKAQHANTWYIIRIGDVPVGWMHETHADGDSGIVVATHMRIALNRLGSQVLMETTERSTERASGAFVRTHLTTRLSERPTDMRAWVDGDSVRVRTAAGGRAFTRVVSSGGPLIGPAGAARVTARALRVIGDSVSFRMFSSAAEMPTEVTRTLLAIDTMTLGGATRSVRRVIEHSAVSPVPVTTWINAHGAVLRSVYESPFGAINTTRADSASAMVAGLGGTLSADQYARTLVRTRVRLPQARRISMLRLELSANSTQPWPTLGGPGQRVLSSTPGHLVLEITRRDPPAEPHPFPMAATPETREYLAPNAYMQSDDSTLHALALRIAGGERDAWRATLALERWVASNMHFDPGIAFAPSTEIMQRRRGTCVAYATLLATLARSLGIPSRVAFGYVYVNGIFGGHAWTEVRIGDAWYAADGAIVPYGSADAARFAFAWGSLARGASDLTSSAGARLYNGLDVHVLAYRVDGGPVVRVERGQAPYELRGDEYRSPTLRVSFRKPAGFHWAALDRTWPSMEIAEAVGGGGDTVRVESEYRLPWVSVDDGARARAQTLAGDAPVHALQVAGRRSWIGGTDEHAAVAIPAGSETIVVEVVGHNARALARRTAASIHFMDRASSADRAARGDMRVTFQYVRW